MVQILGILHECGVWIDKLIRLMATANSLSRKRLNYTNGTFDPNKLLFTILTTIFNK